MHKVRKRGSGSLKIARRPLKLKFRKKSPKRVAIEKYVQVISYIHNEDANEIDLMIASTEAYIERK
jgi:hypothetical protein